MNRLLCLLACFVLAYAAAYAQGGPDEQYVRIYQSIQEADRLSDMGDQRGAAVKYIEAQQGLTRFRTVYPGWNERVVNYRLNYVATKLAPISAALAAQGQPISVNTNTTPPVDVTVRPTNNVPTAVPSTPPATALPMSAEFDRIRELQSEIERLKADNRTLGAKLKEALSAQPAMVDPRELAKAEERIRSLLKENELIKAQVAAQTNSPTPPAVSPEMTAKLAEQNETILALRTENEVLKKQTAEWRDKYAALSTTADAARAQYATQAAESDAAMRKLANESLGLQKQVELWKQVAQQNQRQSALAPIPSMPSDAQRELLNLRARVQTLEAKPVPYTSEELALFNRPPGALVANLGTSSSATTPVSSVPPIEQVRPKVSRGVPPGAQPLLRAAERAFATAQFAEAEKNYLEVLRQDENNVTTLGNLASAQVELGHFADAEKTVTKALSIDPEDFFSLYVLGRIRFRENKMEEALDALSRSAQSNPDYADSQNYLGIVLSERGQRGPAEAALRRAIQLQPNNAVAHNNLAVVYATQTPPALALARWHYQKARDGGHPRNAQLEKMIDIKP
jgi:tetratricopeptide (TPR) repeat protein